MDYKQSIKYIETFQRFGVNLGLDRIKKLLSCLGNPQNKFRSIHVAGTNGKGSVCAILSSIMTAAGYRTGLYTSPHLVDYTERIRTNEKDMKRSRFSKAIQDVKKVLEKNSIRGVTEFEFLTAACFLVFAEENIEIAIIEAGLGGRLDATNVVSPLVSIITNIDLEHTDVLGGSITEIAREKAGIIKSEITLITQETKKDALNVMLSECERKRSKFIKIPPGKDVNIRTCMMVLALTSDQFPITKDAINNGIKKVNWPGRFQFLRSDLLVDGAHNPSGAKFLADKLKSLNKKAVFITGMQKDKDLMKFVDIISPVAKFFIATKSKHPDAKDPNEIARVIRNKGKKAFIAGSVKSGMVMAEELAKNDLKCITGSLYLVGDYFARHNSN